MGYKTRPSMEENAVNNGKDTDKSPKDKCIDQTIFPKKGKRSKCCGSASHCETLSIAVASLSHQNTLSQPPIAFTCSISLFAVFPLRTSPFWLAMPKFGSGPRF